MNRGPKISESEWEVMNVLWKEGPLTAAQVSDRLGARRWKLNTVRTFLTRLQRKRAVRVESMPEAQAYSVAVTREESVRGEAESFLNRFFDGATGALLVHFAENRQLTSAELAELEEIVEQKRREAGRGK